VVWDDIIQNTHKYNELSDVELLYLYMNKHITPYCIDGNIKRFYGISKGFALTICKNYIECIICKNSYVDSIASTMLERYGVTNAGQLEITKINHNKVYSDVDKVAEIIIKRTETCLEKYGVENVFQNEDIKEKIRNTCLDKFGYENPSQSPDIKLKKIETCIKNYGVESPLKSELVKEISRNTCLQRYGVEYCTQNIDIKNKMIKTKMENGGFSLVNNSIEATEYFREYCHINNYDFAQVAFADKSFGLFEFGYNFNGSWFLFDFVAFEFGHRGDISKILEIVEYNGPFHYKYIDVQTRGDMPATPWKTNKTTIKESFDRDNLKEYYARKFLTDIYTVVWSKKYHTEDEEIAYE
jgi:hypothetical protein